MKRNNLWIYLCVAVALLPVLLLRDFTPSNELRYLSIADEALRDGHLFAFTWQGEPYADKPPLYLWGVMFGRWLLDGHRMWFLALFSLLPALVVARVMERWTASELPEGLRATGLWMLLSCGLFLGMTVILRMDMLMCMFIVLALRSFYRMVQQEPTARRERWLFPVYTFLALFSKGPVGILVPLCSTVVYLAVTRRLATIGRYWGWRTWVVLLLCCGAWFGCVYAEGGTAYLNNLLFHQTIDRAVNAFHHEEPFYFYAISIWYSTFPWSLLLVATVAVALRRRLVRTELQRLFLTVVLTTVVMLSLISSKIDVYLLPAFPFLVYLTLLLLPDFRWNRWQALCVAIPAVVFVAALPAVAVLARMEGTEFLGQGLFYAAAAVLTLTGVATLRQLYWGRELERSIRLMACGLFAAIFVGGWALPGINAEIGYGELCRESAAVAAEYDTEGYCVWHISRPEGMDVYLEEDVCPVTWEELSAGCHRGALLMLPSREVEALRAVQPAAEMVRTVGRFAIVVLHGGE